MLEMSIRQFAHLIDGKRTLSETPPLAGENEPIGRVVPVQASYAAGDVVLVEEQESTCVEALQLQGAMGVVAHASSLPWQAASAFASRMSRALCSASPNIAATVIWASLLVTIVPEGRSDDLLWQLVNINQAAPCAIELGCRCRRN